MARKKRVTTRAKMGLGDRLSTIDRHLKHNDSTESLLAGIMMEWEEALDTWLVF